MGKVSLKHFFILSEVGLNGFEFLVYNNNDIFVDPCKPMQAHSQKLNPGAHMVVWKRTSPNKSYLHLYDSSLMLLLLLFHTGKRLHADAVIWFLSIDQREIIAIIVFRDIVCL